MKRTTKTNKDTNQELNQKCSNLQHSASGDQKHGTQPSVIPQIQLAKLALSGPQLLGELGCMGGCSVQASKGCRQEGVFFSTVWFVQTMVGGGQLCLGRWSLCGRSKNAKVIIITIIIIITTIIIIIITITIHVQHMLYLHAFTNGNCGTFRNYICVRYLDDLPTNVMDYLMG